MFFFSARHRRGHLTSGRAAAKAVLGPGCVEGVIKGEGSGEEGRRAGPRLRRLKGDSPSWWGGAGRERRPRGAALGPARAAGRGAAAEAPSKGRAVYGALRAWVRSKRGGALRSGVACVSASAGARAGGEQGREASWAAGRQRAAWRGPSRRAARAGVDGAGLRRLQLGEPALGDLASPSHQPVSPR